jgi:DNA-binding transcriptional regulator YbjK
VSGPHPSGTTPPRTEPPPTHADPLTTHADPPPTHADPPPTHADPPPTHADPLPTYADPPTSRQESSRGNNRATSRSEDREATPRADQRARNRPDRRAVERPDGQPRRRSRDPQARRDALANAAIEVIAEVGIGRTTHRAVAAVAGLPLGATTYYFPTLDALIAAGLQRATAAQESELRRWAERVHHAPDLASALVALARDYLADRRQARLEYELCVAAARDEALRPLASAWQDGLHALLATQVGGTAARNISALLDGAMLQVLVTGSELDATGLEDAITRLAARAQPSAASP